MEARKKGKDILIDAFYWITYLVSSYYGFKFFLHIHGAI